MDENAYSKIQEIARQKRVVRPRDLAEMGIPRIYLSRLVDKGLLIRSARGIYTLPEFEPDDFDDLAEAARQVPKGVICLLSALRFHELTTQDPHEIWVAIGGSQWKPKVYYPAIRFVRFSASSLGFGIEKSVIAGQEVSVYNAAKTVADCFKYRNKIGIDVALEALRDLWGQRKATMDDIWMAAKVCRVSNVMRPYLESLI